MKETKYLELKQIDSQRREEREERYQEYSENFIRENTDD
jgi:hypothetical protein